MERAEMLGCLYELFDERVSVTGTHGKTSTSAMLAAILLRCGLDPTVLIGGDVPDLHGHARLGATSLVVAEACEAYGSFLYLRSSLALVTNVDVDHLDHYGDFEGVKAGFVDFLNRVDPDGTILACADDQNLMSLRSRVERKWLTYGFSPSADFRISGLAVVEGGQRFDMEGPGWSTPVHVPQYGQHFASNAAGALAAAALLGSNPDQAAGALARFQGVARRMEVKGRVAGVTVVDDYAHHPSEIRATMQAAREQFAGPLAVVFQPHLYSRTAEHLQEFADALYPAQRLVITNVYAARETQQCGVQSDVLWKALVDLGHSDAHYVPELADVGLWLADRVRPGDVVITMGAGDVVDSGHDLLRHLRAPRGRVG